MRIPVGGAFHSPLMAPARDRLRKAIDQVEFRNAEQTVYCNVDAMAHTDAGDFADLLGAQLTSPVRWRQTLRALETDGFTTFVELGPGTVLTGLVKRAVKTAGRVSVSTPADVDGLRRRSKAARPATRPRPPSSRGASLRHRAHGGLPGAGIFTPNESCVDGSIIEVGQLLGTVGPAEVRSSFAGEIKGVLAYDGERVTRQPIAWLRTTA